jgi:hypothetical protein
VGQIVGFTCSAALGRLSPRAPYLCSPAWSVHILPTEHLLKPFEYALVCSCIACWIEMHAILVDECATRQLKLIEPQNTNACETSAIWHVSCNINRDVLIEPIIVIVMPNAPRVESMCSFRLIHLQLMSHSPNASRCCGSFSSD